MMMMMMIGVNVTGPSASITFKPTKLANAQPFKVLCRWPPAVHLSTPHNFVHEDVTPSSRLGRLDTLL
jgi:hypothetical protein